MHNEESPFARRACAQAWQRNDARARSEARRTRRVRCCSASMFAGTLLRQRRWQAGR